MWRAIIVYPGNRFTRAHFKYRWGKCKSTDRDSLVRRSSLRRRRLDRYLSRHATDGNSAHRAAVQIDDRYIVGIFICCQCGLVPGHYGHPVGARTDLDRFLDGVRLWIENGEKTWPLDDCESPLSVGSKVGVVW